MQAEKGIIGANCIFVFPETCYAEQGSLAFHENEF